MRKKKDEPEKSLIDQSTFLVSLVTSEFCLIFLDRSSFTEEKDVIIQKPLFGFKGRET